MGKNTVKLAVAGSGKTWKLCKDAVKNSKKNILVISYTIESIKSIKETLLKQNLGFEIDAIEVISWYRFLLVEFIYPFKSLLNKEIKKVYFKDDGNQFRYINNEYQINSNYISKYIYKNNLIKKGISRLERIYYKIYIDEIQDLAGYDINILSELLDSNLEIYLTGDPKQSIYKTHNTNINIDKSGENIFNLFKEKDIDVEYVVKTRRCRTKICDYANFIDPRNPIMKYYKPDKDYKEEDYGVFLMDVENFRKYISKEKNIKLLKYNKETITYSFNAVNIGVVKGQTYQKVAIFPTKKMISFFKENNISEKYNKKIYVGITRAISTVIFVLDSLPEESRYFNKTKMSFMDEDILCYEFNYHNKQFKNITLNKIKVDEYAHHNELEQEVIGVLEKIIRINKGTKLIIGYGKNYKYKISVVIFDNTERNIDFLKLNKVYKIIGKSRIFRGEGQIIIENSDKYKHHVIKKFDYEY